MPFLLSCTSLAGVAQADVHLPPDGFRDALIEKLAGAHDEAFCASRLENAGVKFGLSQNACHFETYTQSAYVSYLSEPSRLETILSAEADRLSEILKAGDNGSDLDARLVVQLRPKSFVQSANEGATSPLAARRFAGDLYAVLMLDSAQTLAAVTQAEIEASGLTYEVAFGLAAENTRARMGEIVSDSYGDVSRLYSENGLISGQVWLPETCAKNASGGVYFLYDYNGVLTVDRSDFLGISHLLSYARNMVGKGVSLSETVVTCQSGEWRQLWPASHAGLQNDMSALPG